MKKRFLPFFLLFFLCLNTYAQREIWGTVSNGGNFGHGYIFRTDSVGNNLTIVHHFDSLNGKNPGALLAASGNKLYGLTSAGGMNNQGLFSGGVLYEYDLSTSVFTALQHFGPNNPDITGVTPAGDGIRALVETEPGKLYGQIIRGQGVGSVVFLYDGNTRSISTALNLPTFQGGATNATLGNRLSGNLYPAADGFLYGTTYTNSQCPIANPNFGSIVRIDPVTNAFSIRYLCPCNGNNGFQFDNNFVTHEGRLYSVTKSGGANAKGVIYSFDPATDTYVNRHNFQGGLQGQQPSTLVKARNGKFYGTAYGGTPEQGFPSGSGILFEFDPVNNLFNKKLDFTYGNGSYLNVGPFPFCLIDGNNGKLYGVNANGVFEYDPELNQTTAKSRFPINMGWYSAATPSLTAVCRKPSYTAVSDSNMTFCTGQGFSFSLQSDNAHTYVWKHDGVADSTRTTATLSFNSLTDTDGGTWICEMTNECGNTQGPAIRLTVTTPLTPTISQTDLTLHASGNGSFQWLDCDNGMVPVAGANAQTFTPTSDGNYAVTGNSACSDTSACFAFAGMGLKEFLQTGDFSVFPNPAVDKIRLAKSESWSLRSVQIRNTAGQTVLRADTDIVNIEALTPGIYFVTAETSAGTFYGKLVKTSP